MDIHQILPQIVKGDAIGNETLLMRDILREWGYKSDIFAKHIQPGIAANPYFEYQKISAKENILIYHYSIGSDLTNYVEILPDKILVIYHNQTPEKFFRGVNEEIANLLYKGRSDLKKISKIAYYGIGDSVFNCLELKDAGFPRTSVLPILIDFNRYSFKNEDIVNQYDDNFINIMFVGRIVPNKRQDEIIKIFYYYKQINPNSRLFLIGSHHGFEEYFRKLKDLIEKLSLHDVIMPGSVSDKDLNSYYTIADIFLCMSEHEGFCVPLVECMYFNVPIIAYNSSAIPFTLKNSGVLVNRKNYGQIAELIDIIINDDTLKTKIVKKQKDRLKDFAYETTKNKFRELIDSLIDEAG